jgi:hypothetical protein
MFHQSTDLYFDDAALQDDLLLLEQSLAFVDYNLESFPDMISPPNFQQMIAVEELPFQTREFTGPVRSKHSNPRVLHAQTCNYCRDRNIKVRSYYHIFLWSLTTDCSILGSIQCARAVEKGARPAHGHLP